MSSGIKNIEDFFTIYKESAWNKDSVSMINLYDHQSIIFDMWDKGSITNEKEWVKLIEDWLGSLGDESVKVDFEMVKIQESDNLGFATAFIKFQAISKEGEVLRSMKNRITLGFTKHESQWKVIHQHTSAPISSEDLSAILDL
ncbi:nuclear transport factor 2 family protein [Fulvivirga sp.]|uniref:YybH family protein n=1 Tax=Fulvivirga sp. TaxID=1931237 RepID=UPI0032EEC71C